MSLQLGLFDGEGRKREVAPGDAGRISAPGSLRATSTREPRAASAPEPLPQAPLRVRESRRARRLTLRMLPPHTLELVVPRGTRPAEVAAFVSEHRRWIERARGELAAHCRPGYDALPERIELAAVARSWPVRYEQEPAARPICRTTGDALLVRTQEASRGAAEGLLRGWLIEQARLCLTPWLRGEAQKARLEPGPVRIRLQRTRWGSCSSSGTISLNAGLMFVAPPLVRYLLIHELCHLVALNHSRRYWRAVARLEPEYLDLDRRLGESWSEIPLWAHDGASGGARALDLE